MERQAKEGDTKKDNVLNQRHNWVNYKKQYEGRSDFLAEAKSGTIFSYVLRNFGRVTIFHVNPALLLL